MRGLAHHDASVPLRSPIGNRRDTDISLKYWIGKDDLCNTNMSRQNKNLTKTHAHSSKNARTELTKSNQRQKNYKDKCWTQVLRTERQQVQATVPTNITHPTRTDGEAKVPMSSSTQTKQKR